MRMREWTADSIVLMLLGRLDIIEVQADIRRRWRYRRPPLCGRTRALDLAWLITHQSHHYFR